MRRTKAMNKDLINEVFKELEKLTENYGKITTEELFAKYGEPCKLHIKGFTEIEKKDKTTLLAVLFVEEPEKIYFAGAQLQTLYGLLLKRITNIDDLNAQLSEEPLEVILKWGLSYYKNKMVVVIHEKAEQ